MNEYSVSDYSIFNDAVATTQLLSSSITTNQTVLFDCQTKLGNESIFKGPICDSCVAGLKDSGSKLDSFESNLAILCDYLKSTSSSYQVGDASSTNQIIGSSNVDIKSLASVKGTTTNGNAVYYNQNGYYDENGNLHRWSSSWGKDISSSGCGPTSMASVLATMYGDSSITPVTVANMLDTNDNIGGNYVSKVANAYHLNQTHEIGLNQDSMNTFLRNDGKMIVAVNDGGHYIAVLGINDSTNPPSYIVCDPNDANTANKTWSYDDISAGHTMVFHIAPQGKTVEQCMQSNTVQV